MNSSKSIRVTIEFFLSLTFTTKKPPKSKNKSITKEKNFHLAVDVSLCLILGHHLVINIGSPQAQTTSTPAKKGQVSKAQGAPLC